MKRALRMLQITCACFITLSCGGQPQPAQPSAAGAKAPEPARKAYKFRRVEGSTAALSEAAAKDEQLVEGAIKGAVLLKQPVEHGGKYSAIYQLVSGKDIEAIDQDGVHIPTDSQFILWQLKDQDTPPDDTAVIASLGLQVSPKGDIKATKDIGVPLISGKSGKANVVTDQIAGELKAEGKEVRLVPAIEVTRPNNEITSIPVAEFIEFKKKT